MRGVGLSRALAPAFLAGGLETRNLRPPTWTWKDFGLDGDRRMDSGSHHPYVSDFIIREGTIRDLSELRRQNKTFLHLREVGNPAVTTGTVSGRKKV